MKVVALEKGWYRKRRNKGDVFNVHFDADTVSKSKWLAPVGSTHPDRRVPDRRDAPMVDVLKGVVDEESEPETMSEMTERLVEREDKDSRAYGREAKDPPKKRMGRPKGSKNKPKAPKAPKAPAPQVPQEVSP